MIKVKPLAIQIIRFHNTQVLIIHLLCLYHNWESTVNPHFIAHTSNVAIDGFLCILFHIPSAFANSEIDLFIHVVNYIFLS